jgi:glycosyltransferase involved in cell wall biosynthesis
MKIIHLCLSNFYIDGFAYQENELVAQNVADGHDVLVIASTETFGSDRRLTYLEPGNYLGTDGAMVVRLSYRKWLPHFLMRKLRVHPGVYSLLEREKPDVILFHSLCGWELITAAKYKKAHPYTRFYVDSHEDFNNSARSFVSKFLLHYSYYRTIAKLCLNAIDKILCISVDTINFVHDFYGVPSSKIEFYPLGGIVFDDACYAETRQVTRKKYEISDDQILFVQSGKLDRTKKLLESLRCFSAASDSRFRFLIAGHLQDDIHAEVETLINQDARIHFLGWKKPEELRHLLCAADIYLQPGTQSATMQMSLCCRCAVILDDVPSHEPFIDGNGWLIGTKLSLAQAFNIVCETADCLPQMSARSAEIALKLLDYKSLAARLYR